MDLWKIAWRSIWQRGLASVLTMASMALGVMLVVSVLSIHGVVSQSFHNNSTLGYNMIVGATKGGKLQLTLNTVFYLSKPVENIPYDYYLKFQSQEVRDEEYRHSVARRAHEAEWQMLEEQAMLSSLGGGPDLGSLLAFDAMASLDEEKSPWSHKGVYAPYTKFAIPLCLGDYFGQFRVVGAPPEMFETLVNPSTEDSAYQFAEGRNFKEWSVEHGYFEAIMGKTVAEEMGVKVGDEFSPSHGDPDGHGHAEMFTVVGILERSGTPHDRAAFVNLHGFLLMGGHSKPMEEGEDAEVVKGKSLTEEVYRQDPLPMEEREVTAVLVRSILPIHAAGLASSINNGNDPAQVAFPAEEIFKLFDSFVNPVRWMLMFLTAMICIVSGVSILVSIYNSMSERQHEIAIMRALGAGRGVVMNIVLLESIMISLVGGLVGWVLAHGLNALVGPVVSQRVGVNIGFFDLTPEVDVPLMLQLPSGSPTLFGILILGGTLGLVGIGIGVWALLRLTKGLKAKDRDALQFGVFALLVGVGLTLAGGGFIRARGLVSSELVLIPFLLLLAIVVGFLPALAAYRTDVVKSLGK